MLRRRRLDAKDQESDSEITLRSESGHAVQVEAGFEVEDGWVELTPRNCRGQWMNAMITPRRAERLAAFLVKASALARAGKKARIEAELAAVIQEGEDEA